MSRSLPAGYTLTDDQGAIDPVAAHAFLTTSYWSPGIALETVQRAIDNSFCVAILHQGKQVAFARAVSDRATFAYVADVYVLDEHRGLGLSHALLNCLIDQPSLRGLRRWVLFTLDGHGLYRQHGFTPYPTPERLMVLVPPGEFG